MKPLPQPPRTRFGAPHLELHRLALVQAPEPVGKQVTLRRRTASVGRTSSRAVGPLARLVHKHVLAAVAARDEPCGVGESQGVSTGDAVFTACGECSVAACSATTLSSTRARTISLGHAEPVDRAGDDALGSGHGATLPGGGPLYFRPPYQPS